MANVIYDRVLSIIINFAVSFKKDNIMKDYFYLNPSKMIELSRNLDGAEIKMFYAVVYCLCTTGHQWFINNADNRKLMAEIGFSKTPERISGLLSSLTKKGVLKREANGVYSILEGPIIIP